MPQRKKARKSSTRTPKENPTTKKNTTRQGNQASRSRASRIRNQSQETLTQIDFVRVSHLARDEGSQDDEDDEFVPQNSRKRKRSPAVPDKRQQTLTQIDWTPRVMPSEEEENLELLEDDMFDQQVLGQNPNQQDEYQNKTSQEPTSKQISQDAAANQVTSTSQGLPKKHQISEKRSEEFERPAIRNPSTPKTVRVQEVPSSQTPAPTPFSTSSTRRSKTRFARSVSRSPLKEVSSNRVPVDIHLLPETSPDQHFSKKTCTQNFSATPDSQRNQTRLIFDDLDADSLADERGPTDSSHPLEITDVGITKPDFIRDQSQEYSRFRTDSEEISSQPNRELLYFTQEQHRVQEQTMSGIDSSVESQIVPIPRQSNAENDRLFLQQDLRPSQISTEDVTQEASSPRSRRFANLPPLSSSSPHRPVTRESSLDVTSSPHIPRSNFTQQGTVTLSQLLPESLMNFNLPQPPDSSQYGKVCK